MSGGSVGSGMSGSKGKAKQKSTKTIPDFIKPFLTQATGLGEQSLTGLQNALSGDTVADFTPEQMEGFNQALNVARGGGGFVPQAQQTFMDAAGGQDISSMLDPAALQALQGASQGVGLDSFVPQNALSGLNQLATGDTSNTGINALTNTAQGDFLFGGQGFDQAVQANVRQALPHIASAFGGTAGGLSGSSARQAVGNTAVDAHARQFGQERQNQLGAANTLGQQQQVASSQLAGLGGQNRQNQLTSAAQLAGLTGNLSNADQARQLQAASQLPNIGQVGSSILGNVGSQLQGQAQREIEGPVNANQQLLASALASLGIADPFLGSKQKGSTESFGAKIGATGGKG